MEDWQVLTIAFLVLLVVLTIVIFVRPITDREQSEMNTATVRVPHPPDCCGCTGEQPATAANSQHVTLTTADIGN